jgi:hypothetical protein
MLRTDLRFATPALVAVMALAGCGSHDVAEAQPARPAVAARATANPADASTWANHVLIATATARAAIARSDMPAAHAAVREALSFSDRLGVRPVPIYEELSSVSVIGPVAAAKGAASATESGVPASQGRRTPAVKAVVGGYTRVILDAGVARARLQAAIAELDRRDFARADADLKAVQQSVILESVSANLPLIRARENITFARTAVQTGRPLDAHKELVAAERALRDYAGAFPTTPLARPAEDMARDIASATGASALAPPVATLDRWWSQLASWTA